MLFSYGVCFPLFSLTSIPDSKTCVSLTILIKLLGMLPIILLPRPKENDGATCVVDTLGCLLSHN